MTDHTLSNLHLSSQTLLRTVEAL